MSWHVYILHCGDGSLYTGIARNPEQRLRAHENGTGARYTRGRSPFTMIYREECPDRNEASRRESEIKKLDRKAKLALCRMTANPGNPKRRPYPYPSE